MRTADIHVQTVIAQAEKWKNETQANPRLGPHLEQIKADIGRAWDAINRPDLRAEFGKVMDTTGLGWNPAFIEAFAEFAKGRIEGKPVTGGGPSPEGQSARGQSSRPSIAQAMYPHLRQ